MQWSPLTSRNWERQHGTTILLWMGDWSQLSKKEMRPLIGMRRLFSMKLCFIVHLVFGSLVYVHLHKRMYFHRIKALSTYSWDWSHQVNIGCEEYKLERVTNCKLVICVCSVLRPIISVYVLTNCYKNEYMHPYTLQRSALPWQVEYIERDCKERQLTIALEIGTRSLSVTFHYVNIAYTYLIPPFSSV